MTEPSYSSARGGAALDLVTSIADKTEREEQQARADSNVFVAAAREAAGRGMYHAAADHYERAAETIERQLSRGHWMQGDAARYRTRAAELRRAGR
jgi:hypothetical protein